MQDYNVLTPEPDPMSEEHSALDRLADHIDRLKLSDLPQARDLAEELYARSAAAQYVAGMMRGKLLQAYCFSVNGNVDIALEIVREVEEQARLEGAVSFQADALRHIGAVARMLGEPRESCSILGEALRLARLCGDRVAEGRVLVELYYTRLTIGELDEVELECEPLIAFGRACGDDQIVLGALHCLAAIHYQRSDTDRALEVGERMRELAVSVKSDRHIALSDELACAVYSVRGDLESGLRLQLRTLDHWRSQHNRFRESLALVNLGTLYMKLGNIARALEMLLESLEVGCQAGNRQGEPTRLTILARVYSAVGAVDRALGCCHRAIQLAVAMDNPADEARARVAIAWILVGRGDAADALNHAADAYRRAGKARGQRLQIEAQLLMGIAHGLLGDFENAEKQCTSSLEGARSAGWASGIVYALRGLGDLEMLRGDATAALDYLERALAAAGDDTFRMDRTDLLAKLIVVCERSGLEAKRVGYERAYSALAQSIFSDERARRAHTVLHSRRHIELEEYLQRSDPDAGPLEFRGLRGTSDRASAVAGPSEAGKNPVRRASSMVTVPTERGALALLDRVPDKPICIRTFGVLDVTIGGHTLGKRDWGRRRARELFKLLLINHGRWLAIDEIHDALWDARPSKNPDGLIANAISHLRGAFNAHPLAGDAGVGVQCRDGAYRLELGDLVWVDFFAFKELVFAARHVENVADRVALYVRAADLYRSDFLTEDLYNDWAAVERDALKSAYLEALEFIARERQRTDARDEAIETSWRILRSDDTNQTALEVLVQCLVAEGRASEARRILGERAALPGADSATRAVLAHLGELIR